MRNLIFLILLFSLPVHAQNYFRAVGIRGGFSSGFTYRQHLDPELAYEGLLSFRQGGLQFTALRQHIQPAPFQFSDDFYFIYGYGGHLGFNYTDHYVFMFNEYYYSEKRFSPLIGLDGFLGLEYHIPTIPVQVGLDLKPFFEFSIFEFFRIIPWDFAFTIKYIF
jgi:hypothetical protein